MSRHSISLVEWENDGRIFNGGNRRIANRDDVQPKWSPIRRKDKMRSEEKMKAKSKRPNKKVQQRIKYEILSE